MYETYLLCVDQIYQKYENIQRVRNLKTSGFSEYLLDGTALQLRKMVEFIILGVCLIHKEAFVKAGRYLDGDFRIKGLKSIFFTINQDYFPVSLNNGFVFNCTNLSQISNFLAHIMHITNPFEIKTQRNIDRKMRKIFKMSDELIAGLEHHRIKLYNDDMLVYKRLTKQEGKLTQMTEDEWLFYQLKGG